MAIDPTPHLLIPSCADCAEMGFHVAEFLHDMEAELGPDAVSAFLLTHGGREISIPTRREAAADDTGQPSAMDWLIEHVGWGKLMLPKGPTAHRARASYTVLKLRREGKSTRQIANATGLHSRTISKTFQRLTARGLLQPTLTN